MHIDVIPNRTSPPAYLLRESYREDGKVKKRTLANLSSLPIEQIEDIRRILKGERLVPPETLFDVTRSTHHGQVEAVLAAMAALGMASLLATRPSRERSVALALIAARVLDPRSKLATSRAWHTTSLPESLGVAGATEDEMYRAMDWLLAHQDTIEDKLAARHLHNDGLVLYDLSSSYFEGKCCPLAARGHNRDGKVGKLQVNYGLLTDADGRPVAVSVFPGNTGDAPTVLPQATLVRERFGVERLVLVGDRGMLTSKQIRELGKLDGLDWIGALRPEGIEKLVAAGKVQIELFDEKNLFEITHPSFPGERLVVCRNPSLAKMRAHKRLDLLLATSRELERVQGMVYRKKLAGKDKIGLRVGRVLNRYKVGKHFSLDIRDDAFDFEVDAMRVLAEAELDGLYVIRTSLAENRISAEDAVRGYKNLTKVERAFRSMKTLDLHVRPIHHHTADRVSAHIFLCMLAYYVRWHMAEAWKPLLFTDEDTAARVARDPVLPAIRSEAARQKLSTRTTADGDPLHSFRTLLDDLSTIVQNTCRRKDASVGGASFTVTTMPTPAQRRALDLLRTIQV
jgi:transposase